MLKPEISIREVGQIAHAPIETAKYWQENTTQSLFARMGLNKNDERILEVFCLLAQQALVDMRKGDPKQVQHPSREQHSVAIQTSQPEPFGS